MKQLSFPLFSLIFIFQIDFSVSSISSSTIGVGKCDHLVGKLLLKFESSPNEYEDFYFEYYQSLASLSRNISNCYGSLEGESARKLKQTYDFRSEKYDFYSYSMMHCFQFIIMDGYRSFVQSCNRTFDFTTNDLTKKRRALYDGQSCLMKNAESLCYRTSIDYLKSNYDQFVNILTVKPEDPNCESLFAELNTFQCNHMKLYMNDYWSPFKNGVFNGHTGIYKENADYIRYADLQCKVLQQCSPDVCNPYPNSQQMAKCEIFDALTSEFKTCFNDNGRIGTLDIESCTEADNRKECVRNAMIDKCGDASVKDFDKYYEFFTENNLETVRKFKTIGNYSEYDDKILASRKIVAADSEIGKCSPLVEEILTEFSGQSTKPYTKVYRDARNTCNAITKCYGSINSEQSLKLKAYYQFACDDYEWSFTYLHKCLDSFYRKEMFEHDKSIDNSDFFSQNMTIKRDAFMNQMTYFLKFVFKNEDCVPATKYITGNYTRFVDQITVKPVDDDCRSVFSQASNYPCSQGVSWLSNNIYFNDDISSVADIIIEECRLANKCFNGTSCYSIYSKYLLGWCESAKKEGLQFNSCLNKLRQDNQDYSNHYCALKTVTKKDRGDDFLMQFELNRECLKYMMMEKCGTDSIRGFNEYFEKIALRKRAEEVKSGVNDEDNYDDATTYAPDDDDYHN